MYKYLYNMYLLGYEVCGINYKKIEQQARLREAKEKYKAFMADTDIKAILEEFFWRAFEAGVILEDQTGRPLTNQNDILKSKFDKGNYRYLLMRVPISYYQQAQAPIQSEVYTPQNQDQLQRVLDYARLHGKQAFTYPEQGKPVRGKVGGLSKYTPKYKKEPSKEEKGELLEKVRKTFEDRPVEKEVADEECK